LILALCRHGFTKAVGSRLILLEAERNVREKLGEDALLRFYQEIAGLDLDLVETPTTQEIAAQSRIIDSKDAHVLAAALKGGTNALLTLDRKHFLTPKVLRAGLPFLIMTPGDYLRRLAS
jgi:predicted nucleic acid-binding protein